MYLVCTYHLHLHIHTSYLFIYTSGLHFSLLTPTHPHLLLVYLYFSLLTPTHPHLLLVYLYFWPTLLSSYTYTSTPLTCLSILLAYTSLFLHLHIHTSYLLIYTSGLHFSLLTPTHPHLLLVNLYFWPTLLSSCTSTPSLAGYIR